MSEKPPEEKTTALTPFGDRAVIRDLSERILLTQVMPGAAKLTKPEAILLAQICIAHGLDPFNGEAWLIKNKEGEVKGTMIGIKGLRKVADRQLKKGEYFYITYEFLTPEEIKRLFPNVSAAAQAYKAILTDSRMNRAWEDQASYLHNTFGLDLQGVIKQLGPSPVTIGYGVYDPAKELSKMHPSQCAKKRAEADAIKQRFNVPLAFEYSEVMDNTDAEDPTDEPLPEDAIDATPINREKERDQRIMQDIDKQQQPG